MKNYIKEIIPEQADRRWFWFVMIVLLSFYPYKLANAYYPFIVSNIQTIFVVSLLLIGIVALKVGIKPLPRPVNIIAMVMLIGCIFSFLMTHHKFYYHKIIIMVGGLMLIQIVDTKIGLKRFFTLYNKWILLMAILGIIGFVISMVGISPIYVFTATEDWRPISSWGVTFSKQVVPGAGFMRYAGFFDEPGAMGYWGIYALVINRLFIKNEKFEKYLIICLLFTFSMGFYSQIAIFIFLLLLGRTSFKKKLFWIFIAITTISIVYATKGTQYDSVYTESIGRFEKASDAEEFLGGTSREDLTKESKKVFLQNPWMGMGWPVNDKRYIGDNPYETLARDGIIGSLYIYFPFIMLLYWSVKRRDYDLFAMTVVMCAGFMHRPFHYNYLTFFILYSVPLMYYQKIQESRE